jgi:hypothetical protein
LLAFGWSAIRGPSLDDFVSALVATTVIPLDESKAIRERDSLPTRLFGVGCIP